MSDWRSRVAEIRGELRTISTGRNNLVDAVLPPLGFVVLNAALGLEPALIGSLAISVGLGVWRLARRQGLAYVAGGLVGTSVAVLSAYASGRAQDYFLAQIASSALTAIACVGSALVGRPLVAFTSHLARGWPLSWYWHRRVRPAYSEVTLAWGALFMAKVASQYLIYRQGRTTALGLFNLFTGWPATVAVLIASYLYGTWRLGQLRGPSVQEYREQRPPPWQGQSRGF